MGEERESAEQGLAKYNTDSYVWYAIETFRAITCGAPNGYNAHGVEKRNE